MGRDMQLEVSPTMYEAIHRLRQRPELLTYAFRMPHTYRLFDISSPAKL